MYSNEAIFAIALLVVAIATRAAIGEIINKKISIINSGKVWEDASAEYAKQVYGEIRAVVGKELRAGNIWENVELPR